MPFLYISFLFSFLTIYDMNFYVLYTNKKVPNSPISKHALISRLARNGPYPKFSS